MNHTAKPNMDKPKTLAMEHKDGTGPLLDVVPNKRKWPDSDGDYWLREPTPDSRFVFNAWGQEYNRVSNYRIVDRAEAEARRKALPEGMKPWHGGEGPPDDWDGGDVLWGDGALQEADRFATTWATEGWTKSLSIIAYHPKPTQPSIAPEVVEHLRNLTACFNDAGFHISPSQGGSEKQRVDVKAAKDFLAQIEPPVDPLEAIAYDFRNAPNKDMTNQEAADYLRALFTRCGLTITQLAKDADNG